MMLDPDARNQTMGFAEDLLTEFERKGYDGRVLFLALAHLWSTHNVETSGKALVMLDDLVMQAAESKCRKRRQ